jgi:hypothetical protein
MLRRRLGFTIITRDICKLSSLFQWQCACALSRSQSVIKRTNSNSTRYYTITYMGELDTDCSSPSQAGPLFCFIFCYCCQVAEISAVVVPFCFFSASVAKLPKYQLSFCCGLL